MKLLEIGTKVLLKGPHVWAGNAAEIIGHSEMSNGQPFYALWMKGKNKTAGVLVSDHRKYEVKE